MFNAHIWYGFNWFNKSHIYHFFVGLTLPAFSLKDFQVYLSKNIPSSTWRNWRKNKHEKGFLIFGCLLKLSFFHLVEHGCDEGQMGYNNFVNIGKFWFCGSKQFGVNCLFGLCFNFNQFHEVWTFLFLDCFLNLKIKGFFLHEMFNDKGHIFSDLTLSFEIGRSYLLGDDLI